MSASRPRAFTLVELMVVVGIIVILLAILVPVIDRAMDAAERANCASNQKQIAQQVNVYGASNQYLYPLGDGNDNTQYYTGDPGTVSAPGTNFTGLGHLCQAKLLPPFGIALDKVATCPSLNTKSAAPTNYGMANSSSGGAANGFDGGVSPARWLEGSGGVYGSYQYRGVSHYNTHNGAPLRNAFAGTSSYVILTDLTDPQLGVSFHHRTGYNRAFGDSSTAFLADPQWGNPALSDVERLVSPKPPGNYPYPTASPVAANATTGDHSTGWVAEMVMDFMKTDHTGDYFK